MKTTSSTAQLTIVVENPNTFSMGPMSAIPIGKKTSDPNQSYALTRERIAEGISRCIVVTQSVENIETPAPETNVPSAMNEAGAWYASPNSGHTQAIGLIVAIRRGLCACHLSMRIPPSTAPAPSAAKMSPQAVAPPRYSFTMTGPNTNVGAKMRMLTIENSTTMTQSHVRAQNSVQPWRSWRRNDSCDSLARQSILMRYRETTLAT